MKAIEIKVTFTIQVPDSLEADDLFIEIDKKNVKVCRTMGGGKVVTVGGAAITDIATQSSEEV